MLHGAMIDRKDCEVEYIIQLNEGLKELMTIIKQLSLHSEDAQQMPIIADQAMGSGLKLSQKLLQFSINCFASMPMLQAT